MPTTCGGGSLLLQDPRLVGQHHHPGATRRRDPLLAGHRPTVAGAAPATESAGAVNTVRHHVCVHHASENIGDNSATLVISESRTKYQPTR